MIKCHIIESAYSEELTKNLQKYLNLIKDKEIIDIKFSTTTHSGANYHQYSVLIIYKTKKDVK